MGNLWHIAVFEIKRLIVKRAVVINIFILPMIIIFILGTALSSQFAAENPGELDLEQAKVALVGGGGAQPTSLERFVRTPDIAKLIAVYPAASREAAEQQLRDGDRDFAVVIPADMDTKIQQGTDVTPELILGKSRDGNMIAENIFTSYLSRISDIQVVAAKFGPQAIAAMQQDSPDSAPPTERYLSAGTLGESGAAYTAAQYYAAAMLMMFLLYSGLTLNISLHAEKENFTLTRMLTAPVPVHRVFLGKLIGNSLIACFQAVFIIVLSNVLFGVDWGNQPLQLALICLLMVLVSMALSVLLTLLIPSPTSSRSTIQMLAVLMTFFSGGMIVLQADWFTTAGKFTVNHWGMQAILDMMLHEGSSQIWGSIGVLAAIGGVVMLLSGIVYRKVGYQ
ncbi:ABC transporter permease [Paenibacillus sp. JX-17]|uniref:ABC transporter permease n=1 Tax=Paenibacillus lacisoli TaxID=3064525 RepID=A0ABT9CBI0_9BACL|nr:ABC transporter permease [Paenibacillus sp. JX-17]MDO7906617.1 ABC transporter permease [Paenibacillus sp. JX-17]